MPWFWRSSKDEEEEYSSDYDSEDYSSEELDSVEQPHGETPPEIGKENPGNEDPGAELDRSSNEDIKSVEKDEKKALESSSSSEEDAGDRANDDEDAVAEIQGGCAPVEFVKTAKSARARLDSGLTFGDEEDHDKNDYQLPDTDSDGSEQSQKNEQLKEGSSAVQESNIIDGNDSEEEEDAVTSTSEKLSLLLLAAEHDRVDILNSILTDEKEGLLTLLDGDDNSTIPPLHIAVSYGSVNATNCLLRMGADPSIRPNIPLIQEKAKQMEKSSPSSYQLHRFDDASAWELVFGLDARIETQRDRKRANIEPLDIPLSKREGIRHAFTAEALRCIGSDEVSRLRQLLESGMPHQIDIGGKHLYDWAVEMGALQCEELLRPTQLESNHNGTETEPKKSVVLDRGEPQSISSLLNRLDESESLSNALSACLDNLGEEVAVCSGLLLLGSGASALASHVRSLRSTLRSKQDELDRLQEAWVNSEDELEYWVKKCGSEGERIASQIFVQKKELQESVGDLDHQRQQLIAQIAACENKIRMLRVSIADLSEENARNLSEVEKRGLSGGITLVRGLREQIKDLDYKISLAKSGDAECCMKISLLQSTAHSISASSEKLTIGDTSKHSSSESQNAGIATAEENVDSDVPASSAGGKSTERYRDETDSETIREQNSAAVASDQISTGQSTAIVLRPPGDRGFFPLSLWQILMRIMGLSDNTQLHRQNSRATPAVII